MRHTFVSPRRGIVGYVQNALVGAIWLRRLRRAVMKWLPFPVLASDVRDIIYLNWVIAADRARDFVPPGVTLQERDGQVILTILSYQHGNFGPAILGPLRRLFGSPLQSKWRFYVDHIAGQHVDTTVLFIANIFDSALYALATRLMSDALPSDLAGRFKHRQTPEAHETIIAGGGSAPGLRSLSIIVDEKALPPDFLPFFQDWSAAIQGLCWQDAAVCAVDDLSGQLARARIDLPIDITTVQPCRCTEYGLGDLLDRLGIDGPPFCFRVPSVPFRVMAEQLIDAR